MQVVIVEATNGPQNWGKFAVWRGDSEFARRSAVDGLPLRESRGCRPWTRTGAEQRTCAEIAAAPSPPPILIG